MYGYLRSDEVANQERQGEHQHLHPVTCHLGVFLAINIDVVEVGSVCSGHCDHRGVSHHCRETISQPLPHYLKSCCGYQRLAFAVQKVRPPQDLGVAIEHRWHNVIAK